MEPPIITGMTLIAGRERRDGSRVLARFDAMVGGLQVNGFAFVRTPRGGLAVHPPGLGDDDRCSVAVIDNGLRDALIGAARVAYLHMGGSTAGWSNQPRRPIEESVFFDAVAV